MKQLILIVLITFAQSLIAQDLTKLEFDLINNDVNQTIFRDIKESKDFTVLINKFNLSKIDMEKVERLALKKNIQFSKKTDSKSHILPFYVLSNTPGELQLTIFSLTIQNQNPDEDFHRGKYHFVLTTTVNIIDGQPYYKNSTFSTDKNEINQWFLNGYKTYLKRTKPIFEKYDYTPPPPPMPPKGLQ